MDSPSTLGSLPSELLIAILSLLPTPSLLSLVTVSHRFYSATLRIVKERLRRATSQPDHRLILECYHPSAKLSTPYLYCDYLYTDSFASVEADAEGGAELSAAAQPPDAPRQGSARGGRGGRRGLGDVYVHFRPVMQDENRRGRARYPPRRRSGGGPGGDGSRAALCGPLEPPVEARPSTDLYLDDGELFSQLCTVTNLVRVGPRPGLFRSHVNVSDGLIRVWRDWLAAQVHGPSTGRDDGDSDSVLWADAARTVGLRFRVAEKDIRAEHPVLVASHEELPVAYRLEFEELLVRGSTLLVRAEKSEVQEVAAEGKAVVLASF